jgi:hypothetical protein
MYERPPPVEPDRSCAMRYWAIIPPTVFTCSGIALLDFALIQGMRGLSAALAALITCIVSAAAWQGRRRGWNPNLLVLLWLGSLIGFAALVYAASRL